MWIEAILTKDDVVNLIGKLLPATIRLGQGELWLHDPIDVGLVPDVGLRVACQARVRWPVLGVDVPVVVSSLTVTLMPKIATRENASALVFAISIDHADVAGIPSIIDGEITRQINRELDEKHVELSWPYADTLDHSFDLPASLLDVAKLDIEVTDARLKVTSEAVGLAFKFVVGVDRRGDGADRKALAQPALAQPIDGKSSKASPRSKPVVVVARPKASVTAAAAIAGALVGAASTALFTRATRRRGLLH